MELQKWTFGDKIRGSGRLCSESGIWFCIQLSVRWTLPVFNSFLSWKVIVSLKKQSDGVIWDLMVLQVDEMTDTTVVTQTEAPLRGPETCMVPLLLVTLAVAAVCWTGQTPPPSHLPSRSWYCMWLASDMRHLLLAEFQSSSFSHWANIMHSYEGKQVLGSSSCV